MEIYFYEMHNCKFLFMLTKHGAWARKYHPYLRCGCKKGEGAQKNREHICTFVDHETECKRWNDSIEHWNKQHSKWHNYQSSLPKKEKKRRIRRKGRINLLQTFLNRVKRSRNGRRKNIRIGVTNTIRVLLISEYILVYSHAVEYVSTCFIW